MTSPAKTRPSAPPGRLNRRVFWPAAIIVGAFVLMAVLVPGQLAKVLGDANTGVVNGLGWYYVLIVVGFVAFALYAAFSQYGDITLARTARSRSTRCSPGSRCCSRPAWASAWSSGAWPSR